MNIYTYNVTHDTIAGGYKVNGKALSFSNYHSNFVFIPTPFPLFFPARADSNITTSNPITQITTSNLIIHSESNLHDSAGNVDTKVITDQYYSK